MVAAVAVAAAAGPVEVPDLGAVAHESAAEEGVCGEDHGYDDDCVEGLAGHVVPEVHVVVVEDGAEEGGVLEVEERLSKL